jgi:hypothetical protein
MQPCSKESCYGNGNLAITQIEIHYKKPLSMEVGTNLKLGGLSLEIMLFVVNNTYHIVGCVFLCVKKVLPSRILLLED